VKLNVIFSCLSDDNFVIHCDSKRAESEDFIKSLAGIKSKKNEASVDERKEK
jgi:hypothetical protein